jgi:RimJ/RimL family protein N-acetyltransferase
MIDVTRELSWTHAIARRLEDHDVKLVASWCDLPQRSACLASRVLYLRTVDRLSTSDARRLDALAQDSSVHLGLGGDGSWTKWCNESDGLSVVAFAITDGSGQPIGACRIRRSHRPLIAYLSFWVGTPYRRRGYAATALGELQYVARYSLDLVRLKARVSALNNASIAALRRASFECWGPCFRSPDGEDVLLYSRELGS